jgi:tripartite-type tricarboxylate transporter receptor subunit TctC
MAGVDLPLVKFNGGGPALREMIANKAPMAMFEPLSAAVNAVRSGKLRALGVTSSAVLDALPGIPPVADTVPGYSSSAVSGIGVPTGTPGTVIEKLNKELNAVLSDAKVRDALTQNGGTPLGGPPEAFAKILQEEVVKWGEVVVSAGVTPD